MRRLVLLAVLVGGLVAALWRWQPAGEAPTQGAPSSAPGGYVATQAVLIDTGDDGRPRYTLRADAITQEGAGGEVALQAPRLAYEGATRWQLAAREGTLPADASRVRLAGGVEARAVRGREPPLLIRTSALDVDLAAQRAETSEAVEVELGRGRLSAVGLHADMKADMLRLESQVHGEYTR